MRKRVLGVTLWVLVAAQMVFIYAMSAQDSAVSSHTSGQVAQAVAKVLTPDFEALPQPQQQAVVEGYQHTTRKAAHMIEYAMLAALVALALGPMGRRGWLVAMAVAAGYAILDETHQLWVNGRSPQFTDVLIDAAGAAVGAGTALILRWLLRRNRPKAGQASAQERT